MKSSKKGIVVAIMVAMMLAAVETTVVTTAIPKIVKDLNGFQLISWVFSLYLLTSTITTPIYGKLADLYGRKNTLSIGISIFLLGSFLCGLSQNMYELIAFRALQGIGAGSIYTITYTIVGDVFPLSERARVQGWLGSSWGIASLVGPFIGGFMIDALSWHWIFFINVPFGILSIMLLQKNLNENYKKRKVKIDYKGTILLALSIAMLLFIFMIKNSYFQMTVEAILIVFLIFLFYANERKSEEPIVPFEIFKAGNISSNITSFILSFVLIGIDIYMPIYLQNVLGYNAMLSGIIISPMSVAWLLSTFLIGGKIARYGEKSIIIAGIFIILVGNAALATLGTNSSIFPVIVFVCILGIGFGIYFTTVTILIQESVDYNMRGAAVASNSLVRNLGQTIGSSVFGNIFNAGITAYLVKYGFPTINSNELYSSSGGTSVNLSEYIIKNSICHGLSRIFTAMIIFDVTALIIFLIFRSKFSIKNKI